MVQIQKAPRVHSIRARLRPDSGENIITIVNNDVESIRNSYPILPPDCWVNGYVKNLNAFSIVNSFPEVALPEFLDEDSETDRINKSLQTEWGPNSPRCHLCLWSTTAVNPVATDWDLVGMSAVYNSYGFPYKTYTLLDLLTQNLADEVGQGGKLGISIKNVGWGVLKDIDIVNVRGSWSQEVIALQPDWQPTIVQGNIQQVTAASDSITGVTSTIKRQLLATRRGRKSGSVRHGGTGANVLYISLDSENVSTTSYSYAIAAGTTQNLPQAFEGTVWAVASATTISTTWVETYNL